MNEGGNGGRAEGSEYVIRKGKGRYREQESKRERGGGGGMNGKAKGIEEEWRMEAGDIAYLNSNDIFLLPEQKTD